MDPRAALRTGVYRMGHIFRTCPTEWRTQSKARCAGLQRGEGISSRSSLQDALRGFLFPHGIGDNGAGRLAVGFDIGGVSMEKRDGKSPGQEVKGLPGRVRGVTMAVFLQLLTHPGSESVLCAAPILMAGRGGELAKSADVRRQPRPIHLCSQVDVASSRKIALTLSAVLSSTVRVREICAAWISGISGPLLDLWTPS